MKVSHRLSPKDAMAMPDTDKIILIIWYILVLMDYWGILHWKNEIAVMILNVIYSLGINCEY